MKARVKTTGEVFEIASYATIPMECCDSFGNPLSFSFDKVEILSEGNDLKESEVPDYWTRLEHQYAGMAMNALLLTNNIRNGDLEGMRECNTNAMAIAYAIVEKLKEKE